MGGIIRKHMKDKQSKYENLYNEDYKVGDKVEIRWNGDWYKGKVIQEGPNIAYKIHYDGWDSKFDESVDVTLCKRRDGTAIKDATMVHKSDRLKVLWGGSWYEATVKAIDTSVCKARYNDYGTSWDTWCTQDEIKKIHYDGWDSKFDESVDVTLCKRRDGTAIKDATMVHKSDRLKVLWGGSWYEATVKAIDTSVCKARYNDYGTSWDTWCTREEIKKSAYKETVQDPNHEYKVGENVKIFWHSYWYKGHVIEKGPNIVYRIHYDGWDSKFDESVDVTLCKWRDGTAIKDATMVKKSDKLRVLWGGTWYNATVLRMEKAVCKVRYKDYGSAWDTWCTRDEIRQA